MSARRMRTLAAVVVVVGLLAALFLNVDFRAASSNTSTNSSISKYTIGIPQGEAAPVPASVRVFVEGSDPLSLAVKRALPNQLGAALGTREVMPADSMTDPAGGPMTVVRISDGDVKWTPVHSRSALTVSVAYASDGDMSWRDEFTVRMGRPDGGPQVRVRGDISVADATTGLISEPAYRRHLAEQIAGMVGGTLKQQLSK